MADLMNYKNVLFNMKREFLIIGLTGYTGSGCSSAAGILSSKDKPCLPALAYTEGNPDEKRYAKLARVWDEVMWEKFVYIQVSDVIFLMALDRALSVDNPSGELATINKLVGADTTKLKGAKCLRKGEADPKKNQVAKSLVTAYEAARQLCRRFKGQCELPKFTNLMQDFGDEIRKYGGVRQNATDVCEPDNILFLPEALGRLIKAYQTSRSASYFVIDAFRNPYEVEFFKRRYSEFYLVHIHREDRVRALKAFDQGEQVTLQERENGRKVEHESRNIEQWITSQNIPECAKKADCYIDNTEDNSLTYPRIRFHLIKLIALAIQPGCIPPNDDERCMQMALAARQSSGCLSRHIGAVVTDADGYVLGVGWNDPPRGQLPCSLRTRKELLEKQDPSDFSEYERSSMFIEHLKGGGSDAIPFCFKDEYSRLSGNGKKNGKKAEYTRALHAEENALFQAARHGNKAVKGGTLYTTDSPCTLCSKKAYHLGIARIVYIEEYPGVALDQSLRAGSRTVKLDRFQGVTGSSYFRLFAPLVYEKDILDLYYHSAHVPTEDTLLVSPSH